MGGTATTDLLGLASSPTQPTPSMAPMNSTGLLVDVLSDLGGESSTDPAPPLNINSTFDGFGGLGGSSMAVPTVEDNFNK